MTTPIKGKHHPIRIQSFERLTPKLFKIQTDRPASFKFRAGQFARLGLWAQNKEWVWRPYSMASAPHDEYLEFFSIEVPGGAFTSQLAQCHQGDALWIDQQPYGFLTLDRFMDGESLWLLASGTGVAPFVSILKEQEVWDRFKQVRLIYSACQASEIAYTDVFQELRQLPHLSIHENQWHWVPWITRNVNHQQIQARLSPLIATSQIESIVQDRLDAEKVRLMICGNPNMVEDCRMALKPKGFSLSLNRRPGQVAVENYW